MHVDAMQQLRVEHEHMAPGQQRRVQLERRVLCRGTDEDNGPVFNDG